MKIIYLATLLLIGCSARKKSNIPLNQSEYFRKVFLKKMRVLQLPVSIPEGKVVNDSDLALLDTNSQDTLFNRDPCYGVLGDTSKFFTVIYYTPAASFFPNIITYDKNGKILDGQNMNFDCWDGGPDNKCSGQFEISKTLDIDFEHTTICYECDSTSTKPIEFTDKGHGRILASGQIEFKKEKIK
jgi:hypothetical protein